MMEFLEQRWMQTGQIKAVWSSDVLILTGDSRDNQIRIIRDPSGGPSLFVEPDEAGSATPTLINGKRRFVIDRRAFDLRADLGGGRDRFKIVVGEKRLGDVDILTGAGADRVEIVDSVVHGRLTIDTQGHDDTIRFQRIDVFGPVELAGGAARDRFELLEVHARREFAVRDFLGASSVYLGTCSFDKFIRVETGSLRDWVSVDNATFKSSSAFRTGYGDDHIRIRDTVFRVEPGIDDGAGEDVLDRELLFSWDFRGGLQGWEGLFTAYPAGQVVGETASGRPMYAEELYRLKFGPSALDAIGQPRTNSLEIGGLNASDALNMFIAKVVDGDEGVIAGRRYQVSYEVVFASDAPRDSGGLEVRNVSGVLPTPVRTRVAEGTNTTYLVADFGSPASQEGANGRYFGDIRHGRTFGEVGNSYVVQVRKMPSAGTAVAGENSELALLVGTVSSYETQTNLHYLRVSARLTPC